MTPSTLAAVALMLNLHGGDASSLDSQGIIIDHLDWTLIFRQTVTSDPAWLRGEDEYTVNPGDPTNAQYSILDTLENFRWADGKFTLQLRWPVAQDYSSLLPQTWRQSTNPATTTTSGDTVPSSKSTTCSGVLSGVGWVAIQLD